MKIPFVIMLVVVTVCFSSVSGQDEGMLTEATVLKGKLTITMPDDFVKTRRRKMQVCESILADVNVKPARAEGYTDGNGSGIFFFQTHLPWNDEAGGLKVWDTAFNIASRFHSYSFLGSGVFYQRSIRALPVFFTKISAVMNGKMVCVMITLSEIDDQTLCGFYISPADNYEQWDNTSDEMLKNYYVLNESTARK